MLGYNFGDGHLHGAYFLDQVNEECKFERGECVQIFIDSCPLFGSEYPWFIRDATNAFEAVESGHGNVHELKNTQPF